MNIWRHASLLMVAGALSAAGLEPVPLSPREYRLTDRAISGVRVELEDGSQPYTLYIGDRVSRDSAGKAWVHFHTEPGFVISEHVRRSAREPLIIINCGTGSAPYRKSFLDTNRFGRIIEQAAAVVGGRLGGDPVRIWACDISSFSAGYGAVRELMKDPRYTALIERVVLCDSLYGGLVPEPLEEGRRVVEPEHIEPWLDFCRRAVAGEKVFLLTSTAIPTANYASTDECARALARALEVPVRPGIEKGGGEYPLRWRADSGGLHIWAYGGDDAAAHLSHVRHLAEIWEALDGVRERERGEKTSNDVRALRP